MAMTLEEEILNRAGEEMAREIDREILWGMLVGIGWTRVILTQVQDNTHAVDITHWLKENVKNAFERRGKDFIFEDERDAVNFILRWQ